MEMNAPKVKDIIGDNPRFHFDENEPYGYYICSEENQTIRDTSILKYWEKLKYMSENADFLIQQAFQASFYDFYGVNRKFIASSEEMCQQLIVDSFVLYAHDDSIGCCLSNSRYMFGHFIECLWNVHWALIYSTIC